MPLKKPVGMSAIAMPVERQGSFHMSETGSFSQNNFTIGKNGITQSPLLQGEVTSLRLDQLELGPQLGRGASAKVYLAMHRPTGKPVALKVLENELESNTESRRLLLNEIKLVYNARSDHLLTFYDAFLVEGKIYLALEYMDRGSVESLFELARQSGQLLPENVLANLLVQILDGLTYLHKEQHAVHRDLKPANVLINSFGSCKLSDFGVSKQLGSTHALAETQVGTTAYMSPERIRADAYAYASDIWSFAIIALEGALGGFPYPEFTSYFDVVKKVVDGPVPTEDPAVQQRLPPELCDLVHACLSKDPSQRPDVLALMRHVYVMRHQSAPIDLGAWLRQNLPPPEGAPVYEVQIQTQASMDM